MTLAWVIGSGGLLGSALCRELDCGGTRRFAPGPRFSWRDEAAVGAEMVAAVDAFAAGVRPDEGWEIYWSAGLGTMGSSPDDLASETKIIEVLLRSIARSPRLFTMHGALAFASSAGAVYGGSSDHVITEKTPVAPTTPYAREKLKQENLLRTFAAASSGLAQLNARISTLYGTGQARGKPNGLIAHIARCVVRNQPIQIYVPLDTIRDYIIADDAASRIVAALRAIPGSTVTKIVASEQPTTIAAIIGSFKRVARRMPRTVSSTSELSGLYSRRIQFHSIEAPALPLMHRTSLLVGIAQLLSAERVAFARGSSGARGEGR